MKHTFLLQPGAWQTSGIFRATDDKPCDASGEATIVHQQNLWVSERVLHVQSDPPHEIRTRHAIQPLLVDQTTTTWIAADASLGKLLGTLRFFNDKIVAVYVSGDGQYSGFENLERQADGSYLADGALMRGHRRLSSWRLTLMWRER